MHEHEFIGVLETQPRPGRLTVTTTAGELYQPIGFPTWNDDGRPDTEQATEQLRTAG